MWSFQRKCSDNLKPRRNWSLFKREIFLNICAFKTFQIKLYQNRFHHASNNIMKSCHYFVLKLQTSNVQKFRMPISSAKLSKPFDLKPFKEQFHSNLCGFLYQHFLFECLEVFCKWHLTANKSQFQRLFFRQWWYIY